MPHRFGSLPGRCSFCRFVAFLRHLVRELPDMQHGCIKSALLSARMSHVPLSKPPPTASEGAYYRMAQYGMSGPRIVGLEIFKQISFGIFKRHFLPVYGHYCAYFVGDWLFQKVLRVGLLGAGVKVVRQKISGRWRPWTSLGTDRLPGCQLGVLRYKKQPPQRVQAEIQNRQLKITFQPRSRSDVTALLYGLALLYSARRLHF